MRSTLVLALAGLCFSATNCYAAEATLRIKAKIISKADWDQIQANDSVTIDNYDDEAETFEFAVNAINVTTFSNSDEATPFDKDDYFVEPYSYNDLTPETKFPLMDINDDGLVTRREYLKSTGTPLNNSDFDDHDRNRDGFLTRNEIDK